MIYRSLAFAALMTGVLLGGLLACQTQGQQNASAVDTTAIKSTLDSLRSEYEEAYNAGEIMASLPHENVISSPPGRPPIRGRDSVLAHAQETRPPGATIELTPIDTRVLSSEWVYEMGTATIRFTPEEADTPRSTESTYLAIFRKTPDGWKNYRESISSNAPPGGSDGN